MEISKGKEMSPSIIDVVIKKHEVAIIVGLCIIAAIRVFIFCAAFPFFNNVDEHAHFDTVHKYSRGYLFHRGKYHYDKEVAQLIVLYGTPEYLMNEKRKETAQKKIPKDKIVSLDTIESPILPQSVIESNPEDSYNYA